MLLRILAILCVASTALSKGLFQHQLCFYTVQNCEGKNLSKYDLVLGLCMRNVYLLFSGLFNPKHVALEVPKLFGLRTNLINRLS